MRPTRRALLTSMTATVAAPAMLRLGYADTPQVTLKLHHSFSAVSAPHEKFLAPWARKVEADSGGRIRIELFPSMQLGGAPAQLLDQARDGAVDIVWAAPGSTPGRFAGTEAFELPFVLSHRALVNSRAIQDYAAANLRDEFRDVHPLCFSCRDRSVLHAARLIKTIDDLKDLRLHVPSRLAGDAVRALGAQGVSVPTPQVRMALAAHAIDGCLDPWDVVPSLRLNDVLKNHTDFAGSALSAAPFVLAMNKAAHERLPRDLKAAIDANAGQVAAGMAGVMWDVEARAVAETAGSHGEPIAVLTPDETAQWRKATGPVIAAWQKQMTARKLDGGKLIAAVRELVAKYADEPEPQPAPSLQPSRPAEQKIVTDRQAPVPAASSSAGSSAPAAKPPPAAAAKPKELDIPL